MIYTKTLSVKQGGKWQDVSQAYSNLETVIKQLKDVRSKVKVFYSKRFDEAKTLISKLLWNLVKLKPVNVFANDNNYLTDHDLEDFFFCVW